MGAAKRIRRQHAIGFRHLARLGRPIYKRKQLQSVADAIQKERAKAARIAAANTKRKKR